MANAKLTFKTPLLPLSWVQITGQGKLKMNKEDNGDPANYNYTATVTYPDKASMEKDKAIFDKFWRENKPAGCTKQSYAMFKPEMKDVLGADGKPTYDEDDAKIKEPTGRWNLAAKTITHWPKDGKPNIIKVLRANGNPLQLGDKVIGEGSIGVVHGSIGINAFSGNEGLAFYLDAVQLKKFVEYTGGSEVEADDLGEDEGLDDLDMDVADVSNEDGPKV